MSKIHCGWCGEAGHRINHCNHPSMKNSYIEHKSNGKQYYKIQIPTNEKYNLYLLSISSYSLKRIKAIAIYSGYKNIGIFSRKHLTEFICIIVFNYYDLKYGVRIPNIEYTINPLIYINCCQPIKSNIEFKSNIESSSECCICYNNIKYDTFVNFNCNHKTCLDCFKQLISYKSTTSNFPTYVSRSNIDIVENKLNDSSCFINCPLCRSVIDTIYYENDILTKLKNKYIQELKVKQDLYIHHINNILYNTYNTIEN